MGWLDTVLVLGIITLIGLLVWSRAQQQNMLDTMREVRDFLKETFGGKDDG